MSQDIYSLICNIFCAPCVFLMLHIASFIAVLFLRNHITLLRKYKSVFIINSLMALKLVFFLQDENVSTNGIIAHMHFVQTCASICVRKLIPYLRLSTLWKEPLPRRFSPHLPRLIQPRLNSPDYVNEFTEGHLPRRCTLQRQVFASLLYTYRENQVAWSYSEQVSNGTSEENRRVWK